MIRNVDKTFKYLKYMFLRWNSDVLAVVYIKNKLQVKCNIIHQNKKVCAERIT